MEQYIDMAEKKVQEDLASGDPARIATANAMMPKIQQMKQHYSPRGNTQGTPFNGMQYLQQVQQNNPWQGLQPMASKERDDQNSQFRQNFNRGVLENDRTFGLQESGITGMYQGQQTPEAKRQALADALNIAGVTGLYDKKPTLQSLIANSQIVENQAQAAKALKPTGGSKGFTAKQQYDIDHADATKQEKLRTDAINYWSKLFPGGDKVNNFALMSPGMQEDYIQRYFKMQGVQPQQQAISKSSGGVYSNAELDKLLGVK